MNGPFTKLNLVLLAALVLQLGAFLVLRPDDSAGAGQAATATAGAKPFAGLKVADVTAVVCKKREAAPVRLEAKRTVDGDKTTTTWTLADRDHAPAKAAEAERLITTLAKVVEQTPVARRAKHHAGLNVSDANADLRVTVYGENGRVLADAFFGESRDFSSLYLRKAGDETVYRTTGAALFDFPAEAASLAETEFLKLDASKIVAVRVKNEHGEWEARKETPESRPASQPAESRASTETQPAETQPASQPATPPAPQWRTVGAAPETLDTAKVETWLRGLSALSLSEPIGKARKPEYGLDAPTATAALVLDDGTERVVAIGAERKDQYDFYAAASHKDLVVTVKSYNVTDWFKKALKDLKPAASGDAPEDG
ncbi:MAG TPA: DUF4340 domain-containing protein [Planctomycetota bacterium]|nr:DUF4340 domain-containing protein [Planctomycetota bacterium]